MSAVSTLDDIQRTALIEWFNPFTAKDLANWFHSEVRTAHSWKQGALPSKHIQQLMAEKWGIPFILRIWGPIARLSEMQNAQIQIHIAMQAIAQAEKGLADAQKTLCNSREFTGTSSKTHSAFGVMDFVKGLTASVIVGLGLLAGASTVLPQHEDMGRVRTARVRVVRTRTEVV